jgi:hypothetical protein
MLNAWRREEEVRCVVLAWKVIVSFEFCGFRHPGLSHSATARLRRLTGV